MRNYFGFWLKSFFGNTFDLQLFWPEPKGSLLFRDHALPLLLAKTHVAAFQARLMQKGSKGFFQQLKMVVYFRGIYIKEN